MDKQGFLFFDLDGTIADSGAGITASMNDVFARHGVDLLTDVESRRIIGPPLQTTMPELLATRRVDHKHVDDFIEAYRKVYREQHLPHTPIIEGMKEVLNELSQRWYLSVVTAKPQAQANIAVRAVGVEHHMVTVVGPADDAPLPKARLLERALSEVHARLAHVPQLEHCWMIGDRHHDIDAAIEVGTQSIGVLWGYGDNEELQAAGAHAVVSTPQHIVEVVSQSGMG